MSFSVTFSFAWSALTLLSTAFNMGFTGIGIAKTFIHVDIRSTQPVVWTYS